MLLAKTFSPNFTFSAARSKSQVVLLDKIGRLELLKSCYSTVYITREILSEYGNELPTWVIVEQPKDASLQKTLEQVLDKGEASALALAMEKQNSTIIL